MNALRRWTHRTQLNRALQATRDILSCSFCFALLFQNNFSYADIITPVNHLSQTPRICDLTVTRSYQTAVRDVFSDAASLRLKSEASRSIIEGIAVTDLRKSYVRKKVRKKRRKTVKKNVIFRITEKEEEK